MLFRTTVIASAALAFLATVVNAHSWADCVDWRFNDPKKPGFRASDGKCFGWARKYPLAANRPFGTLDSFSPNRHYQQNPADFTSCSDQKHGKEKGSDESRQSPISKSYDGQYGAMASTKAGAKICLRWPAKNHAVKEEPEHFVFINMPNTTLTSDPNQSTFSKANIAKIPFKNCNNIAGDTDLTPCGGCFTIPATLQTGTYVVQWRWQLNPNEFYTSCWDLGVTGAVANGTATLGSSTSIFADLAED